MGCLLALLLALALPPLPRAVACGLGGTWPTFEDPLLPDHPKGFRQGRLGILRPGMGMEDLVIAWRQLKRLPVRVEPPDPQALEGDRWAAWDLEIARDRWLDVRKRAMAEGKVDQTLGEAPPIEPLGQMGDHHDFFRILPYAFAKAGETLEARIKAHGQDRKALTEWVRGQDAVFSCTEARLNLPRPVQGPPWLKADRAYQIAAALFYAERYAEARSAFQGVGQDTTSPWRDWAPYLQVRCLLRQYSRQPVQDRALLREAKVLLTPLVDAAPYQVRQAAEDYLDLVRHHLEPAGLQREMLRTLSSRRDLDEVDLALERLKALRRRLPSPIAFGSQGLGLWLQSMGARDGKDATPAPDPEAALKAWKRRPDLPGLLGALWTLPAAHPAQDELWKAADQVPERSPAHPTLAWLCLRRDLASTAPGDLNQRLEEAATQPWLPPWAVNTLRKERRGLATNLGDWLTWAPSRMTGSTFMGTSVEPFEGKEDALAHHEAETIQQSVPLEDLATALTTAHLPKVLCTRLATAAWTRSVLLERWPTAQALLPLLDEALAPKAREALSAEDPLERRFRLACLVLVTPGLSPEVPEAFGRGMGLEWVPLEDFSGNRDNFWCQVPESAARAWKPGPNPGFLSQNQVLKALEERRLLAQVPSFYTWCGTRLLDFAQAHPTDPRIPEMLHRMVRVTRLPSCPEDLQVTQISRRCFRLLHDRYPRRPWARRTPFHY